MPSDGQPCLYYGGEPGRQYDKRESADKPGSVVDNHSSGYMSPCTSSNLPGNSADHALCSPIWSCSEWGLPCHKRLPVARCALTAPFHPYLTYHGVRPLALTPYKIRRFIFCCTFRRLSPPRRYLALCPMEPGLSSPKRITLWRDCLANSRV